MTRYVTALLALMVAVVLTAQPQVAMAETHIVKMLNRDPEDKKRINVYEPEVVYAKPGDVVKYLPTDPSHNVESMKGMLPKGVKKFRSKINKVFEVKVTESGVYGVKCTPHFATGMVGLIVVEGDNVRESLEKAKKVKTRGRAKKRFKEMFAEVEKKLDAAAPSAEPAPKPGESS